MGTDQPRAMLPKHAQPQPKSHRIHLRHQRLQSDHRSRGRERRQSGRQPRPQSRTVDARAQRPHPLRAEQRLWRRHLSLGIEQRRSRRGHVRTAPVVLARGGRQCRVRQASALFLGTGLQFSRSGHRKWQK